MQPLLIYKKEHIAPLIHLRRGEQKIGERVRFLEPDEGVKDLAHYPKKGIPFALLGIPESIGPMANYGNCCTDHAWNAFLDALEHHLQRAYEFHEQPRPDERLPLGIEVDMDSMIDMPSSALTPSGFRVEEVRRFVGSINARFWAAYLHLAEGAPVIHTNDMIKVGKTLAYLVLDFVKTAER